MGLNISIRQILYEYISKNKHNRIKLNARTYKKILTQDFSFRLSVKETILAYLCELVTHLYVGRQSNNLKQNSMKSVQFKYVEIT